METGAGLEAKGEPTAPGSIVAFSLLRRPLSRGLAEAREKAHHVRQGGRWAWNQGEASLPGAPAASFYSQRMLWPRFPRIATPELVLLRDEERKVPVNEIWCCSIVGIGGGDVGRLPRVHFEGAVFHVYNRLARGERVFDEEREAAGFRDVLAEVVERDELTVFAWCLMGNHYHLAVRVGRVSLDRPMRSLQQRVARGVNMRRGVYGPLWQGRYRARLVSDERYFHRLLAYIHLNPVTAGLVKDPGEYRWSGHLEILGKVKETIVNGDEVLALFGRTRGAARRAYGRRLRGALEEEWIGEAPGWLPWWRVGRPRREEEDLQAKVRREQENAWREPVERFEIAADAFVERGAEVMGVSLEELRGRFRSPRVVEAREVLSIVGVERYGLKVKDLSRELAKSPATISKAISRALRRRLVDPQYRKALEDLDQAIARASDQDE